MSSARSLAWVIGIVASILLAARQPWGRRLLRWAPIPCWCYVLPLLARSLGWLPADPQALGALTQIIFPIALALLLLGTDVGATLRLGASALGAAACGALGIVLGVTVWTIVLRATLPADPWMGGGILAATWIGGTLNLLALANLLAAPASVLAPLIVVDAVVTYAWMALLVAGSGVQATLNRWLLGASAPNTPLAATSEAAENPAPQSARLPWRALGLSATLAVTISILARGLGARLPTGTWMTSPGAWTVLLATTGALGVSLIPAARRAASQADRLGYPALYLVLAATGAQSDLSSLRSAPAWIALGIGTVLVHGAVLLIAGRLWKWPMGLLATASQANVGGVVSAPMVGAVYHQRLAAVGLILAMIGNALGTYCGLGAAYLLRALLRLV